MVPEELTNKELLELKQECMAEEEEREKEAAGEENDEPKENSQKGFSRGFCSPQEAQ